MGSSVLTAVYVWRNASSVKLKLLPRASRQKEMKLPKRKRGWRLWRQGCRRWRTSSCVPSAWRGGGTCPSCVAMGPVSPAPWGSPTATCAGQRSRRRFPYSSSAVSLRVLEALLVWGLRDKFRVPPLHESVYSVALPCCSCVHTAQQGINDSTFT